MSEHKEPAKYDKNTIFDKWHSMVGDKAARKLRAKDNKNKNVWFGFGLFGLIGWSVAIPALLGAALGTWLDDNYAREQSWTLTLLLAGLTLGCFNAWYWLKIEQRKINKGKEDT